MLEGPYQPLALPGRDRDLSVRRAAAIERSGCVLDEVQHLGFEARAVEAVDLLDARRARHVDLGHQAADHVEPDEVQPIGRQPRGERPADLAVAIVDGRMTATRLAEAALAEGLRVVPLARLRSLPGPDDTLLVGFGAAEPEAIRNNREVQLVYLGDPT